MDPRIGWNQPENNCLAFTAWNEMWEMSKFALEKNIHEQQSVPSPLANQPSHHLSNGLESNFPVPQGSQRKEYHVVVANSSHSTPAVDSVPALRDGTQNQNIPQHFDESPHVEIPRNCPPFILQMQQSRKLSQNNRIRKQREDIENKRRQNKALVCDRNIDLPLKSEDDRIPWKKPSKTYPPNIIGLHEEMKDFHQYISPTPAEHRMRSLVIQRIEDLVRGLWPTAKVDVFGSFRTHLYLPTSDIDLVIFGNWDSLPLRELEGALKKKGIAHDIKVLDRAAVPIVKMIDNDTDIRVDIGFNIANSVKSANLIKDFMVKFPCLPYLVFVVKQYLLQSNLNEVWTGGISSYSLILMCVSFLQLHRIQEPRMNLGSLLIEFFELYGRHFNYFQTGIRITDGGSYVKKEEIQKDMDGGHRASFLCIEDPLTPGNDIGRSSYGALLVKQAFEHAFVTLNSAFLPQNCWITARNESILSRIIHITNDVIVYRRRINERFVPPSITPESNDSDNDECFTSASQENGASVK